MTRPKRAGKPPKGSRRNLRDTGGEKNRREVRHGQRQKNLRATGRAPVLPAVRGSGGCRRMSPCPGPRGLRAEFPHPFCGSGPADRGVDQNVIAIAGKDKVIAIANIDRIIATGADKHLVGDRRTGRWMF